jgi:hypothetical protein
MKTENNYFKNASCDSNISRGWKARGGGGGADPLPMPLDATCMFLELLSPTAKSQCPNPEEYTANRPRCEALKLRPIFSLARAIGLA